MSVVPKGLARTRERRKIGVSRMTSQGTQACITGDAARGKTDGECEPHDVTIRSASTDLRPGDTSVEAKTSAAARGKTGAVTLDVVGTVGTSNSTVLMMADKCRRPTETRRRTSLRAATLSRERICEEATFHVLRGNNLGAEEASAAYKRLFNSCFPGEVRPFSDSDYVVVYGRTESVQDWRAFCIVCPSLTQKARTYRWPAEKLRRRLPSSAIVRYDIVDLGVDAALRGRGVGKRLLTHALATIRAETARLFPDQAGRFLIDIQVYATNPVALAMYIKHGFRVLRETAAMNDDTRLPDRYIELSMTV